MKSLILAWSILWAPAAPEPEPADIAPRLTSAQPVALSCHWSDRPVVRSTAAAGGAVCRGACRAGRFVGRLVRGRCRCGC